ncbi:VOC family protein [Kitasatospora sp. NBC_01287]|nr:VOC family protein [Kitasatospora sp. NBC_01287]
MRIKHVTVDCADPPKLAAWWAQALGGSVTADFGGFYALVEGGGLAMGFQKVPEARTDKNSVHVDLAASDRAVEIERLIRLGATEVAEHTVPGLAWTVLRDPEGNEFCVSGPAPDEPAAG